VSADRAKRPSVISSEVQRTIVKSPPELWAELSDPTALARHLGVLGEEIRITRAEHESLVEWETEGATGTVAIAPSGWGTKVTLTVTREQAPGQDDTPPPEIDADVEPVAPSEAAPEITASERFAPDFPPPLRGERMQAYELHADEYEPDEPQADEPQADEPQEAVALEEHAALHYEPAHASFEPLEPLEPAEPAEPFELLEPLEPSAEIAEPDDEAPVGEWAEIELGALDSDAPVEPERRPGLFRRFVGWFNAPPETTDMPVGEDIDEAFDEDADEFEDELPEATPEVYAPSPAVIAVEPPDYEAPDAPSAPEDGEAAVTETDPVPDEARPAWVLASHVEEHAAIAPAPEHIEPAATTPGELAAELQAAEDEATEEMTAVLTAALDSLGSAHHRPFSRS
jgi:hypothetical protein